MKSSRSLPRVIALFAVVCLSLPAFVGCGGKGKSAPLAAEEQFALAMGLYERGKFFDSAEEFQKVIYNYPGGSSVDSAQYFLAMSYLQDKQFELAAVEFERLVRNYPRSPFAVEARFRTAYSYFRAAPRHHGLDQTEVKRAVRLLNDFLIDYPDSEYAPEAQQALYEANTRLAKKYFESAVVYTRIRAWRSAEIYFQYVIDNYSNSNYTEESLAGKTRALLKQRKWDEAALSANSFLGLYPDSDFASDVRDMLKEIEHKRPEPQPAAAESPAADDSAAVSAADGD
ncbi:MAG TPA: outer membrane protein assembly factor BamD [candidate division Zixibacteria bacterium]|nr:outer membrane protein assembly factor BamD [candidate division Zixibacteria bacterium]